MKRTPLLSILVAAIALVFLPTVSFADDREACLTGDVRSSFAPCTAVIENPATSESERAQAHLHRGHGLALLGKHPDALADFNAALKLNPDFAMALNNRAWSLFRWKNTAEGLDDVNRALQLDGTMDAAWDTRAHINQLLGKFEEAMNDYEAAIGFGGDPMTRTYQCGLRDRGLYKGPIDGIYSSQMREAMRTCAFSASCDPLPRDEHQQECDGVTS